MAAAISSTDDTLINFTHSVLQNGVEKDTTLTHNFGVINVKVDKTELRDEKYHMVFSIDRSGSMGTEIDTVKETLKNILSYLVEIGIEVYVTILFFNRDIEYITQKTRLDAKCLTSIISKVTTLMAEGMTNIEKVFESLSENYDETMININMFMTDGSPTEGESKMDELSKLLNDTYEHNMLGFGEMHNSKLLHYIASEHNGHYYFIDSADNAGLIYGEILNKILYRKYVDITFVSETPDYSDSEIEFYNYKTNEWCSSFCQGYVGSEDSVDVHFRFPWDATNEQLAYAVTYKDAVTYADYTQYFALGTDVFNKEIETEQKDRCLEVEKYYYRQLVLEVMYKGLHTQHLTVDELSVVSNLFNKINKFIEDNELEDDTFMKQLLDDLAIMHRTTSGGQTSQNAYNFARHVSQGNQCAYNINNVPIMSASLLTPCSPLLGPLMQTSNMYARQCATYCDPTIGSGFGCSSGSGSGSGSGSNEIYDTPLGIGIGLDPTRSMSHMPLPRILSHSISQDPTSTYSTPQQTRVMSSVLKGKDLSK